MEHQFQGWRPEFQVGSSAAKRNGCCPRAGCDGAQLLFYRNSCSRGNYGHGPPASRQFTNAFMSAWSSVSGVPLTKFAWQKSGVPGFGATNSVTKPEMSSPFTAASPL